MSKPKPLSEPEFISGKDCDRIFGLTPDIRKTQRLSGSWYEPVHFVRLNSRYCVYRYSMIQSWIENQHQPEKHLANAENLLRELGSQTAA